MTRIISVAYAAVDTDLAVPTLRFAFSGDRFTGLSTSVLLSVTDASGDMTPLGQGTAGADGTFIVALGRVRSGTISWSIGNPSVLLFSAASSLSAPFSGTVMTPIVTQIEQSLTSVLQSVTIANGYQVTLSVESATTQGNIIADLKAVVSRGEFREVTDNDRDKPGREVPLMHDGYFQTFNIDLTRAQSALDIDAATALADADIRKAIKANYTFGGLVQNIFWGSSLPIFIGQIPAIRMSFEAFFYTKINDPYTQ